MWSNSPSLIKKKGFKPVSEIKTWVCVSCAEIRAESSFKKCVHHIFSVWDPWSSTDWDYAGRAVCHYFLYSCFILAWHRDNLAHHWCSTCFGSRETRKRECLCQSVCVWRERDRRNWIEAAGRLLSGPQMLAAESHASHNTLQEFLAPDELYIGCEG